MHVHAQTMKMFLNFFI